MNKTVKYVSTIAILSALLIVQEWLLTFVPYFQLTVFLLILFSKKIGFKITSIIIFIYVLIDNLLYMSFNLLFTPFMLIGWLFIPLIICTLFQKTESILLLGIGSIICSFLYCWAYVIPNYIVYEISPITYLLSDIAYECIFAGVSFTSIIILYKPCEKVFKQINLFS